MLCTCYLGENKKSRNGVLCLVAYRGCFCSISKSERYLLFQLLKFEGKRFLMFQLMIDITILPVYNSHTNKSCFHPHFHPTSGKPVCGISHVITCAARDMEQLY